MIYIYFTKEQKFLVRVGESKYKKGGLNNAYGFKSKDEAKKFTSDSGMLGAFDILEVNWVHAFS